MDDSPEISPTLEAQQALRISNDLYGSHVLSAFELAKGFSRPCGAPAIAVLAHLFEVQETLYAKRTLTLILQKKDTHDIPIAIGYLVDLYVRLEGQRRGRLSSPLSVLAFNGYIWTTSVPLSHSRTMNTAIEDGRSSISDDSLAALVRSANDELDDGLDELHRDRITGAPVANANAAVYPAVQPAAPTFEAADPGTMYTSPLATLLQITMLDNRLSQSFETAEASDADCPVG